MSQASAENEAAAKPGRGRKPGKTRQLPWPRPRGASLPRARRPVSNVELMKAVAIKIGRRQGRRARSLPPADKEAAETNRKPLLDLSDAAVRKMIKNAKKRGYVTYEQFNGVLPSEEVTSEQIEDIWRCSTRWASTSSSARRPSEDEDGREEEDDDDEPAATWSRSRRRPSPRPRSPSRATAPMIRCACICARWARWSCSRARAKSPSPSASRPAARR